MRNKQVRKIPARPEEQHSSTCPAVETVADSLPAWFPAENAGFAAWARAAERAQVEYERSRDTYDYGHGSDREQRKSREEKDAALQLRDYALHRAYPRHPPEVSADPSSPHLAEQDDYITFLELDPMFYGSGYAKASFLRLLKRSELTQKQRERLQRVVLYVIDMGFRRELRDFCRLARHIQSPEWLAEVKKRLDARDPNRALRARWVIGACEQKA